MKLNPEPKPVLALCLNPAWQKTLIFRKVNHGEVNRALEAKQCGGGKGVNVVRVFRMLGLPIALAGFAGGDTGAKLKEEITGSGAISLIVETAVATRCCTTVISQENSEVTELIEPSGAVSEAEQRSLLQIIQEQMSQFGAVVCSGTVPPGVTPDFYASVAEAASKAGIPLVLDAVNQIAPTLEAGVSLLKINASELRQIAKRESLAEAAATLLGDFSRLNALAVTDGADPAWLFTRHGTHKITIPRLPRIVSAIGGGDCTTAIVTRRLAEGVSPMELPDAFAEALACASASCLTDTPSLFDPKEAEKILGDITIL